MNLGLTAWPECLTLYNLEGLSRKRNSTEHVCKYEQNDFNQF